MIFLGDITELRSRLVRTKPHLVLLHGSLPVRMLVLEMMSLDDVGVRLAIYCGKLLHFRVVLRTEGQIRQLNRRLRDWA